MGDGVKQSFVIFFTLEAFSVKVTRCQKLQNDGLTQYVTVLQTVL